MILTLNVLALWRCNCFQDLKKALFDSVNKINLAETSLQPSTNFRQQQGPKRPLTLFLHLANTKCYGCYPATFSASAHQHIHHQPSPTASRQGKELCTKPQKIRVTQPLPSRASVPLITYWHTPTVCTPGILGAVGPVLPLN